MNLAEFDYELPEELIAQEPLEDRAASRMLVVHRREDRWEDRAFRDFPTFLEPGDTLVLNDSRVFPARLFGRREAGGATEIFLLRPASPDHREWQALVRPGRKLRTGTRVRLPGGLEAEIIARGEFGERTVRFNAGGDDLWRELDRTGHIPLPPYIKRPDRPADRDRYQTVFARERGSVAAPTAGLHFTPEILDQCRARAAIAQVTLHVGLGTFQPLHEEQIEEARLHCEHYDIAPGEAAKIRDAQRVVAVGTTSVRTVETAWRTDALRGETDIFIYPGYEFRRVGALLTNFHLPRTSLLLLVCALAGKELALAAYRHAVAERYRFYLLRRLHVDPVTCEADGVCRSIKVLRRPGQPATGEELDGAALQFVRKISGFHKPSKANQEAFEQAVREISAASDRLLKTLGVPLPRRTDTAIPAE